MKVLFDEILSIEGELETIDQDAIRSQNITYLMEFGIKLSAWIAFSGNQMAIAKKLWNDAKRKAYMDVRASMKAVGDNYGPMLFKDFVSAKCSSEEFAYDTCERVNRSATHTLDFIRTCLSTLKTEMITTQQTASFHA